MRKKNSQYYEFYQILACINTSRYVYLEIHRVKIRSKLFYQNCIQMNSHVYGIYHKFLSSSFHLACIWDV